MFKLANGQPLTAEEMQRLINRADSDKPKKTLSCRRKSQKGNGKKNSDRFFVVSGSIKSSRSR
jgi:hypothetical protein